MKYQFEWEIVGGKEVIVKDSQHHLWISEYIASLEHQLKRYKNGK